MKSANLSRACASCLILLIMSISPFSMAQTPQVDPLQALRTALPKQVDAWKVEGEDRIFDTENIFSYINGGAEVYKAYNMRGCLSRRYANAEGIAIVLDIFDMATSEDAFGVFTHDTDGEVIDVGQDGRFRPGWLSFWKDRFFVSIYLEEESEAAEKTVKELGRQVAHQVKAQGTRPGLLLQLPQEGLLSENIRYLHHPTLLNYHYYLADENILNINAQTDAVLAGYRRGQKEALLLLVSYPDAEKSAASLASFFKNYLPDADNQGAAQLENGKWAAARVKDRLLAIVLEADSRKLSEDLLIAF